LGNLLGGTNFEFALDLFFCAGFWRSTVAQYLLHGEARENAVKQHAPVCHRPVLVWHNILPDMGPGDSNPRQGANQASAGFVQSVVGHRLRICLEFSFRWILAIDFRIASTPGRVPRKCRAAHAPVCHRPVRVWHAMSRWGPWRLRAEARVDSSFGVIWAICWGAQASNLLWISFLLDLGNISSHSIYTTAGPKKMSCSNMHLPVTDRCETGTTCS